MTDREGCRAITPYFTVADADGFISFLEHVFDGVLIKMNRTATGHVQHARVRISDSVIMLNQASDDYAPNASQMHLFLDDADAVYTTALAHGGRSIMEPNDRPFGERMAGIEDPSGNRWWIASALK